MTSAGRDFASPDRAPTVVLSPSPNEDRGRTPTSRPVQSPVSPGAASDSPGLQRTGTGASRLSVPASIASTARYRKPSRTATVTTYREQQNATETENFQPGAEPGVDTSADDDQIPAHLTNLKADCDINIIDFSDENVHRVKCDNESVAACLDIPRTEDMPCRWISVNGLSWDVIRILGNKYNLHRLAIEDLIHTKTRTKVDWYADHAFVVLTLQKLVRLHQHKGSHDKCTCNGNTTQKDDDEINEKFEAYSQKRRGGLWKLLRWFIPQKPDVLPRYLDRDRDGKIDEYVSAHSGVSEDTPIKPIRTLHRYESAQIPEHTAWMERHSALSQEDLAVSVEQVSLFLLSDNSVISFFEHSADDVEKPILERLHSKETILRRSCDASLVTQAIIDAIVDLAAPVRDAYNTARKELQIDAMTNPNIKTSRSLHIFGEEVDMLQNLFKPIVHLVNALRDHNSDSPAANLLPELTSNNGAGNDFKPNRPKDDRNKRDREGAPAAIRKFSDFRRVALTRAVNVSSVSITPLAHTYFGDVLDHCITMISALEQMDASANNISTLIFNTVGAKTNNFMYILAVVTVFFAPLTFISGYFGMNFAKGGGLAHPFGFFWVVAIPSLVGFMLLVFGVMLWDNVRDFFARRGIKARWHVKKPNRRIQR